MSFWGELPSISCNLGQRLTVATSQLQYSTYWQEVMGWSPIHVAAAMLPQGIAALIVGGVTQAVPGIINKPRISISVGAVRESCAAVLSVTLLMLSYGRRRDPPNLL